jgi:hypothetical protein
MLYTLRVLRTAPPAHSVAQSICYIYIIITTPCRYCRQCYTRMLYATLRASRFACYRIVQHTIHMHAYRIVSYNILSIAHACRWHGTESYYTSNIYICMTMSRSYTRIPTEKANPFFTSPNRAGGWAFSKSFPLRAYGFKIDI